MISSGLAQKADILICNFPQVEKCVTVVSKALVKAGRFFEANGLEGCSKIATSVKKQVLKYHNTPSSIAPNDTAKLSSNSHIVS